MERGVRGHIIVYPQRPSSISTSLPPPIDDVVTPICVVFVGSKAPTAEWLQTKANPLTVRHEKVMNALYWLKKYNHLYRDIEINESVFDGHDDNTILPFRIQHIIPSTGTQGSTSESSYTGLDNFASTTAAGDINNSRTSHGGALES